MRGEILRSANETSMELIIHLSESVIRCSSRRFIEVLLEVGMCRCEVNHIINEESVIPRRLSLHNSSIARLRSRLYFW